MRIAILLSLCCALSPLFAQQRVDAGSLYHRVYAVVPLVGSGTSANDPKRPMFAPPPNQPPGRNGIIAFQHVVSDDGNFALTEFVAADRGAFNALLNANNPNVKVFEVGKSTQAQIEAVFKTFKASFSFQNFRPLRVQ